MGKRRLKQVEAAEPSRISRTLAHAGVELFPSSGDGGIRRLESVVHSIRSGRYSAVVLRVGWLGHTDYDLVRRACKCARIRLHLVRGGVARLRAVLERLESSRDAR